MTEICNDNRFELIEKYKKELLESTNIADSKEEMDVIDSILFRFWQMSWLDGVENANRLLNDCNTYKIRWAKASRTARAEAIKEFAERVTSKLDCIPQHHFTEAQVLYDIDKTVKEMTEDLNDETN